MVTATQQPTRRARERGSPVRPTRHPRGRPSLSADKVAQYFLINDIVHDDDGVELDYTWHAHQVRFVLWYHLTTNLPNEAIATAFNATFDTDDGEVPEMEGRNVQVIIDTVKARLPAVDEQISQNELGHWPRPTDMGWIPCDHGMPCATLAEASQGHLASVLRNPAARTRGAGDIVAMATSLWEGAWDEFLTCPRKHKGAIPATTTPIYSPPTVGAQQRTPPPGRRRPPVGPPTIEPITNSDDSASQPTALSNGRRILRSISIPKVVNSGLGRSMSTEPTVSVRSPREINERAASAGPESTNAAMSSSNSSNKENNSPAKKLRSTSHSLAMATVEEEPTANHEPARASRSSEKLFQSGRSSGGTSYRTAYGRSFHVSGTLRQSVEVPQRPTSEAASPRSLTYTAPRPRSIIGALIECLGGFETFWFMVQFLLRVAYLSLLCIPFVDLLGANLGYLTDLFIVENTWHLLQFSCIMVAAMNAYDWVNVRLRGYMRRRWHIDIVPPGESPLAGVGFIVLMLLASHTALSVWRG